MKHVGIFLIVVILLGAIMFVTNPTTDDFSNHLERKAASNAKKYTEGSKDIINDLIDDEDPLAGSYSAVNFERHNYYVLSIYENDSLSSEKSKKYLGLFKVFFEME